MNKSKEMLKEMASKLSEEDAAEVLRFARWLRGEEGEELTRSEIKAVERGKAQIKAGQAYRWREVQRSTAR